MLEIDLLNFYKGRKLLYKRIARLHKEHILDPTVIQKVKNSGLILDPTIKQDTQHIDSFALRQQMGSPNKDLTTTLIRIQSLLVPLSDRQIPVTFFKPETFDRMTIFLHGGGYIGGSSRVLSHQYKYLAECSHALVVSIDYRLAPENPFPAAYNDCYEVVKWLIHNLERWHIDQKKFAISGESAGGALALAISASDLGSFIALTVPIYGALDIQPCEQLSYWSYDQYQIGESQRKYMITRLNRFRLLNDLMIQLYCYHHVDQQDPRLSPLYIRDFQNFHKVIIVEAEYDYYRLANDLFAKKLIDGGIDCGVMRYQGMDHGFYDRLGSCIQTKDCIETIALYIKNL